jgi:hypothetical protein
MGAYPLKGTSTVRLKGIIQTAYTVLACSFGQKLFGINMDKIIAISIGIALLAIGFIRILLEIRSIQSKIASAVEFHGKLGEYIKSQGKDIKTYFWLIQRSPKFQDEMGFYGLIASFSPPFSSPISNYPAILNLIPELRREFSSDFHTENRIIKEYASLLNECILRHIGTSSDSLDSAKKNIKNPILWFTNGISWVLLLPLSIFHWFGLLSETIITGISNNPLFKIIAGLSALASFISTIMTIVVGWDAFLQAVKAFFK